MKTKNFLLTNVIVNVIAVSCHAICCLIYLFTGKPMLFLIYLFCFFCFLSLTIINFKKYGKETKRLALIKEENERIKLEKMKPALELVRIEKLKEKFKFF